mgnify:FL=1|tara:strand:+ start:160 stop:693 length:534 start_codon:yes stop_codon:yes gene_type:complete
MWKYHGQTIKEGKAWTDLSGVQHPANWNIWPKEHKESLGLVEIIPESPPDSRLYKWSQNPDGTITKTAKALDDTGSGDDIVRGVKYNLKQEVKNQQGSLLAQTDWAIIRKADKDIAVPSNIQTWRDAIRTKATEMETAIDNAADTDAVAALFLTYTTNEDNSQTKSGILYDWPELGE